ncbi:hypothetical protein DHEL01_v205124 [Diaporthe helianthi]|uniref:Uncharacterized protein n=1 Tax=Diaporthe helianthi TaxID=158607 RepID=A0A2P5I1Y2_DIAHE|nr:hypothetical protein DHEL01_v205124 [Diaporthe helianthi]
MASKVCNWMLDKCASTFIVENEDVSLETLRGRNPPCPARRKDSPGLVPPQHKNTPRDAAEAAAKSAVNGYVRALEEKDPKMVAARTAQAIAVAASTSGTHAGFVAAATAVESAALLYVEDSRNRAPYGQLKALTKHAINAAVDAALAGNHGSTTDTTPPPYVRAADTSDERQPFLLPKMAPDPPNTPLPSMPPPPPSMSYHSLWMDWGVFIGIFFMIAFLVLFVFGEGLFMSAQCGVLFALVAGMLVIMVNSVGVYLLDPDILGTGTLG